MNKKHRYGWLLALAVGAGDGPHWVIDAHASELGSAPLWVGTLSRPDALEFRGNDTFTKVQILGGLIRHLDYHLAAHPRSPWDAYAGLLERKIVQGYQREGFPEATLSILPDTRAGRVRIEVREGPRYRRGEIRVSGPATEGEERLRRAIAGRLQGRTLVGFGAEHDGDVHWRPGGPAPFDGSFLDTIRRVTIETLAELNHHGPTINVRVEPDAATGLAALQIDLEDPGIRGILEEISISGLRRYPEPQVVEWLELAAGQEVTRGLAGRIERELRSSARFLRQTVNLTPLPEPGKYRLDLDLKEWDDAPALDAGWSPEAEAIRRFCEWIMAWREHPENVVVSLVHESETTSTMRVDAALSSEGAALAVWSTGDGGRPQLEYGLVLSPQLFGFYPAWRQKKWVVPDIGGQLHAFIRILPDDEAPEDGRIQIAFGAGFNTSPAEGGPGGSSPIALEVDVVPAALLNWMLRTDRPPPVLENGVLAMRRIDPDRFDSLRTLDLARG